MNKLLLGILYGLVGQVLSFFQLQGSIKFGWYEKYPLVILLSGIPAMWFFVKSVECFVSEFNGELWPSRLIGFGIGIITFVILSWFLFKEPITIKTFLCLILACSILGIQILWR